MDAGGGVVWVEDDGDAAPADAEDVGTVTGVSLRSLTTAVTATVIRRQDSLRTAGIRAGRTDSVVRGRNDSVVSYRHGVPV